MSDDHVEADEGGESACFAHLICPECGVVIVDAAHLSGCTWVESEAGRNPKDL